MAWYNDRKIYDLDWGNGEEAVMAVIESGVKHKTPLRFNDSFELKMQVKLDGIRIHFQYAVFLKQTLVATGFTLHVPVNGDLKIVKVPLALEKIIAEETWTETWP